jgi:hypothetical protein
MEASSRQCPHYHLTPKVGKEGENVGDLPVKGFWVIANG